MANLIGRIGRSATGAAKIPLKLRVKAWWEGFDLTVCDAGSASSAADGSAGAGAAASREDWETDRVVLLQDLWGPGFSSPGGERFIQKLIEPFGLDETMAILDLGAGLGGTTRSIAKGCSARTSGLEPDEDLARAGMELSKSARMASTAPIASFGADGFVAKRNAYDCVFSKEFMFMVEDKTALLTALRESLSDSGQLQVIDYVVAQDDLQSAWLDQWIRLDWRRPFLWSFDRYSDTFEALGFSVLMGHDISDEIYELVSEALSRYMQCVQDGQKDAKMLEVMAREIHIWESRMKLLKAQDVRIFRFHVKKKFNRFQKSDS